MSETIRLPLASPVALTAAERKIWIIDSGSNSLAAFESVGSRLLVQIPLDAKPTGVASAIGFVVVGLASGEVVGIDAESGNKIWRRAASAGDIQLKSGRDHVWVCSRSGTALLAYDLTGNCKRINADGVTAFAPTTNGVFCVSPPAIEFCPMTRENKLTTALPLDSKNIGAVAVCANALWLSVPKGLLLFDLHLLELRATLAAPEGPVPHLICEGGRLFGAGRGVFMLNPAADAKVWTVLDCLQDPIRGIAVSATKLWALEAAQPVAHIVDVF